MTHAFRWRAARLLLAPAMLMATLAWAAPEVSAQNTQTTQTQPQAQTTNQNKPAQQTTAQPATQTQTKSQTQTSKPPASQTPATSQTTKASQTTGTQAAQTTSAPADEPLYSEFKGVRIGTSQTEARKKLGNPEVKSKEMDIFTFSDKQRARVVYDANGNAVAVVVTYIGKNADAPAPKSILGTDADSKPDGSLYKIVYYPKAGYWVSYSRTAGDEPMTFITMQKIAN